MKLENYRSVVNDLYRAKIMRLEEQRRSAQKSQLPKIDEQIGHYRSLHANSLVKELATILAR